MIYNKAIVYADKNSGQIYSVQIVKEHMDLDIEKSIELYKICNHLDSNVELEILIYEPDEYKSLIKPEAESIIFVNKQKRLDARYKIKTGINTRLIWGLMDPQRNYTEREVQEIYLKDYLDTNLYNCLNSNVLNNLFNYKFLSLNELALRPNIASKNWDTYFHDPFLKDAARDKLKLAESILEKGTYFPIQVLSNPDGKTFLVREGNHRIYSLKIAEAYGLVPQDFKILSIILPHSLFVRDGLPIHDLYLKEPIKIRYNIDPVWGCNIINDKQYYERVKNSVIENNGIFLNDYTVETTAISAYDSFQSLHIYPIFLRDLFYKYPAVQPSLINTDQNLFNKWIKGEKHAI